MAPSSHGPTVCAPKLWTLLTMLDRVRNVPNSVSANVEMTSTRFHTFSIPRRSCTITEWRNAVAVSHGRNAAFSTGSQIQ